MSRRASINRRTRETSIDVTWSLDESGSDIETGIGFFDHMLDALAKHSGTAITLRCDGDLHVDGHHTSEDVGIALGQCLRQALGERIGIERFGHMQVPLDEALVAATIDISGRGYLVYDLQPQAPMIGSWDTELVREFWHGFADHACVCLHLHQVCGDNSHHIVEAAFKAAARALRQAIAITGDDVPSTKGMLA